MISPLYSIWILYKARLIDSISQHTAVNPSGTISLNSVFLLRPRVARAPSCFSRFPTVFYLPRFTLYIFNFFLSCHRPESLGESGLSVERKRGTSFSSEISLLIFVLRVLLCNTRVSQLYLYLRGQTLSSPLLLRSLKSIQPTRPHLYGQLTWCLPITSTSFSRNVSSL